MLKQGGGEAQYRIASPRMIASRPHRPSPAAHAIGSRAVVLHSDISRYQSY
jgi:hypothetical protein